MAASIFAASNSGCTLPVPASTFIQSTAPRRPLDAAGVASLVDPRESGRGVPVEIDPRVGVVDVVQRQRRLLRTSSGGDREDERDGQPDTAAQSLSSHVVQYSQSMPTLTFLGPRARVTGSKHLLDLGDHRVLVDCGLFQGLKELRLRNWEPLGISAAEIDAVVLTHAHLDHCGYLPRLSRRVFAAAFFCTPGTRDLCTLVLPDSARFRKKMRARRIGRAIRSTTRRCRCTPRTMRRVRSISCSRWDTNGRCPSCRVSTSSS